jgi:hypothetical protein
MPFMTDDYHAFRPAADHFPGRRCPNAASEHNPWLAEATPVEHPCQRTLVSRTMPTMNSVIRVVSGAICCVGILSFGVAGCCGKGGGGCDYGPYDGQCTQTEVKEVSRSGGMVTMTAHYETSPKFGGRGDVELTAPEAQAAALRAHMESFKTLPCTGRTITKGSCSPGPVTITMSPFAAKK